MASPTKGVRSPARVQVWSSAAADPDFPPPTSECPTSVGRALFDEQVSPEQTADEMARLMRQDGSAKQIRQVPALPDAEAARRTQHASALESPSAVKLAQEGACCGQRMLAVTGAVVLAFSTSILLVNSVKFIYTRFDFKFHLFVACSHMLFSWALTGAIVHSRRDQERLYSLEERFRKVFPISIFNAGSIASANACLLYIYPSFHEMLQSTMPLVTLVTSIVLERKRFSGWAYAAMIPLCGGAAVSAHSEVNFSHIGAGLSILALWLRALKVTLQGRLLCDEKVDSVTLCYYMAPFNVLIFGLGSAALEGKEPFRRLLRPSDGVEGDDRAKLAAAVLGSSLLACAFNVANFFMVRLLGAVGSTVVNNAKTPATIGLSVLIFGNPLTLQQICGYALTFLGVWLYGRWGKPL